MQGLKGVFWNSEGTRDPGKHLLIKESVRDLKLDFIALSETGRAHFSQPFLSHLAAGQDFIWFCLPPHGRLGGMLIGINSATLQVRNVEAGDFCVKLSIRSKGDGFEWVLVSVYGAAQDAQKPALAELARICEKESLIVTLIPTGFLCLILLLNV
jgi:hypothetical protein